LNLDVDPVPFHTSVPSVSGTKLPIDPLPHPPGPVKQPCRLDHAPYRVPSTFVPPPYFLFLLSPPPQRVPSPPKGLRLRTKVQNRYYPSILSGRHLPRLRQFSRSLHEAAALAGPPPVSISVAHRFSIQRHRLHLVVLPHATHMLSHPQSGRGLIDILSIPVFGPVHHHVSDTALHIKPLCPGLYLCKS